MTTLAEDAGPGPAAELAPMVEMWFRILAEHVPDGCDRCRACSGSRSAPWPCQVRVLAERARAWHAIGVHSRARTLRGPCGLSCALTVREREFLQVAADGYGDAQIALRLGVPERTVRTALRRIARTIGVADRDALLVLALRAGVIV